MGKFETPFEAPPQKENHKLSSLPKGSPKINTFVRTGTNHDFHVGLKSLEHNVPLKEGLYMVDYEFEQ